MDVFEEQAQHRPPPTPLLSLNDVSRDLAGADKLLVWHTAVLVFTGVGSTFLP